MAAIDGQRHRSRIRPRSSRWRTGRCWLGLLRNPELGWLLVRLEVTHDLAMAGLGSYALRDLERGWPIGHFRSTTRGRGRRHRRRAPRHCRAVMQGRVSDGVRDAPRGGRPPPASACRPEMRLRSRPARYPTIPFQ